MRILAICAALFLGLIVLAGCSAAGKCCGDGDSCCKTAYCPETGKTIADGNCPEADRCPKTGKTIADGVCPEADRCPITGKTSHHGKCAAAL